MKYELRDGDTVEVAGFEVGVETLKAIFDSDSRVLWRFGVTDDSRIVPICFSEKSVIWLDEAGMEV